jgi:hypothetical protein
MAEAASVMGERDWISMTPFRNGSNALADDLEFRAAHSVRQSNR